MTREIEPLLGRKMSGVSSAPFAEAVPRRDVGRLPQTIAHRGYKAAYPENTMAAFRGAVAVGAHALETDLHLSNDGVVVLSHDLSLKRCFGINEKIADCEWSYLQTLRTVREPREPMPRLCDLLTWLAQPELDGVWVLLDIKMHDDAETLMKGIAKTVAAVPESQPWKQRIVLGCWNANYMKFAKQHLPGFRIAYIGFTVLLARSFLREPDVDFNIFQKVLVGPLGARFMADARAAGRNVYVWTVNEEEWMEWSIRKGVDGVITDDPKLFREVCDRWEESKLGTDADLDAAGPAGAVQRTRMRRSAKRWVGMCLEILLINVLTTVFTGVFIVLHGWPGRQSRKQQQQS